MAKKRSAKKKATKKKAARKKAEPEFTDDEVNRRIKEIEDGTVSPARNRHTMADVWGELEPEVRAEIHVGAEARAFREYRLFSGLVDLDLLCGVTFGKRIQVLGDPNYGKSLTLYKLGGAFHRTCRHCFTPIIRWVDDWTLCSKDAKSWERVTRLWNDGGECPFPEEVTCACGRSDPMAVLVVDPEESFDPYWANIWGMDVGDFDAYDAMALEEDADVGGGGIWRGIRISPDSKLLVCRPTSSLIMEKVILPMIEKGAVDAILIDSLASFAVEEDLQGNERIASRARFLRRFLPLMLSKQMKANTDYGAKVTVVGTNQYMQGPSRTGNPRENPNKAAGGQALKYQSDQTVELVSSKTNAAITDGWKHRTVMRDIVFKVTKAKVSGSGGGRGDYRVYLDDYAVNTRLTLHAGDTDEAEKLLKYMSELKDDRVYRREKRGSTTKAYWVLGRPFKRVKDIVAFLHRPDIQYQLRFILFAAHLPVSGKLHLRGKNYGFNPFKEEPALGLIGEIDETVGESLRKVRGGERATSPGKAGGGEDEFTLDG